MCLLAAAPALGQRIQFPSQVAQAQSAPTYASPAPATPAPAPGSFYTAPPPAYGPPAVTLDGSIQPVHPSWDPYAAPGAQAAPLYPPGGYLQPGGLSEDPWYLLHEMRFDYTWVAGDGSEEDRLGINRLAAAVSAAFPFLWNPSPLVVTPGFAINYLDGPDTPPAPAPLPPRLFDAYLEFAWKPAITSWLSADLATQVGVYSDFRKVTTDALRFPSRGLAVFSFSQAWQVSLGVWWLDRNRVKLLPAGGVTWTPSPDTKAELIFPNPRIAHRFSTLGNTDLWWYVRGEYGGGAWEITQPYGEDRIDINDLRAIVGIEFVGMRGIKGYIEAGYVWDREVIFVGPPIPFKPDDTVMLGGGLSY